MPPISPSLNSTLNILAPFLSVGLHAPTDHTPDYFLYQQKTKKKTFTLTSMVSRSSEWAYCSSTQSSVSTYHEPLDLSLQETKPSEKGECYAKTHLLFSSQQVPATPTELGCPKLPLSLAMEAPTVLLIPPCPEKDLHRLFSPGKVE